MELKEDNGGLIEKIGKEAEEEAREIINAAKKDAETSISSARTKAEQLRSTAEARANEQAEEIASAARSRISMEKKRIRLETQEGLYNAAVTAAVHKIEEHGKTPAYRGTVLAWLVEAAAGLGSETVLVSGGSRALELIDEKMLQEAQKTASEATGKKIILKLNEDAPPLDGMGIRVSDESGRLAWDNRLSVRLRRKEQDIRRIVSSILEDEEEQST